MLAAVQLLAALGLRHWDALRWPMQGWWGTLVHIICWCLTLQQFRTFD